MATIKGKILSIGEERKWVSEDGTRCGVNSSFVLEYKSYNHSFYKVVFQVSDKMVEVVKNLGVGAQVEVFYQIYAREWRDKLYNNVDAYKIEVLPPAPSNPSNTAEPSNNVNEGSNGFTQEDFAPSKDDLPF